MAIISFQMALIIFAVLIVNDKPSPPTALKSGIFMLAVGAWLMSL